VSKNPKDQLHNSHWLDEDNCGEGSRFLQRPKAGSGPSRYVAYYDAASLYPSSGEEPLNIRSLRSGQKYSPPPPPLPRPGGRAHAVRAGWDYYRVFKLI